MPIRAVCSPWAAIFPASGCWRLTASEFFHGTPTISRFSGGRPTRASCSKLDQFKLSRSLRKTLRRQDFSRHFRPRLRRSDRGLRHRAAGRSERHLDHLGNAGSLYQAARAGLCPFGRDLVRGKTRRRPLRRLFGQSFLWRVDVSPQNRRVKGGARDPGGEIEKLGIFTLSIRK